MFLYAIPIILSLFGAIYFDINGNKRYNNVIWFCLFLYMTLFMGLRFGVGGDTVVYMIEYKYIPTIENFNLNIPNRFEHGFNFLMSLGKSLSSEFVSFQLIHIFIVNTILFYLISKYSNCRYTAFLCCIFVFYYYFTTEILRESLAVLIFACNYNNLKRHRWINYYILAFLSALCHTSAFILFIIPFFTWIRFDSKYPLTILITIIIGLLLAHFFTIFSGFDIIYNGINTYANNTSSGLFSDFMNLCRWCLFPLLFILYIKFQLKVPIQFENMIAIMILLGILTFFSPLIFSRLSNYFKLFFSISFANGIIQMFISKKSQIRQFCIVFASSFVIFYGSQFLLYRYYIRLIPYYSIFNPVQIDRDNYN